MTFLRAPSLINIIFIEDFAIMTGILIKADTSFTYKRMFYTIGAGYACSKAHIFL